MSEGLRALREGRPFPSLVLYGGGYFYPLHAFVGLVETLLEPSVASAGGPGRIDAMLPIRAWSAMLSCATIFLVYACGARVGGRACGLLAATLIAFSPLAVREAHFAKADSAAAFGVALFLLSVTAATSRRIPRAMSIGAATALATNTKMVIGILPAALLALALPRGSRGEGVDLWGVAVGAATAVIVTLSLNAFWLSDPAMYWTLARGSMRALSRTDWLAGSDVVPGPFTYHAIVSLRHGCGLVMALISVPALVYGWKVGGAARVIAVYAATEWLKLLASPMVLARFFLPVVPALAVLSALLVVRSMDRVPWISGVRRVVVLLLVGLVMAIEPLWNSRTIVAALGRADTRTLAAEWIARELPRDAVVVTWGTPRESIVEWGVPALGGRRLVRSADPSAWRRIRASHVLVHSYPLPHSSVAAPPELSRARRLAVFDPAEDGSMGDPVLEPLDAFYLPLARGSGFVRPGPRIEIFAIPPG